MLCNLFWAFSWISTEHHHLGLFFSDSICIYICVGSSFCRCTLTVWVFIRQPVVVVAMQLSVRFPSMALLLSWVTVDILTLIGVAHLELISCSHTGTTSIGWSEKVARHVWFKMCFLYCARNVVDHVLKKIKLLGFHFIYTRFLTLDCHSREYETLPLHHRSGSTVQTHSMCPSFHLAWWCQGSTRCSDL